MTSGGWVSVSALLWALHIVSIALCITRRQHCFEDNAFDLRVACIVAETWRFACQQYVIYALPAYHMACTACWCMHTISLGHAAHSQLAIRCIFCISFAYNAGCELGCTITIAYAACEVLFFSFRFHKVPRHTDVGFLMTWGTWLQKFKLTMSCVAHFQFDGWTRFWVCRSCQNAVAYAAVHFNHCVQHDDWLWFITCWSYCSIQCPGDDPTRDYGSADSWPRQSRLLPVNGSM